MKLLTLSLLLLSVLARANDELTQREADLYLGGKTTVLCDLANEGVSIQIQLSGSPSKWVVWYSGRARGAQSVLSAMATPLEGMNLSTQFLLKLERGTKIDVELDTNANGSGTIFINSKTYKLVSCRPKF